MVNFQDKAHHSQRGHLQVSDNLERKRPNILPGKRSYRLDPTTATAMCLSELRSEERAAMSREDMMALQEIRRCIERELAE
jgi:hypothetical protein